jgi:hypothetical protein
MGRIPRSTMLVRTVEEATEPTPYESRRRAVGIVNCIVNICECRLLFYD